MPFFEKAMKQPAKKLTAIALRANTYGVKKKTSLLGGK